MNIYRWIGSAALLAAVAGSGLGLASWKRASRAQSAQASAALPEPVESIHAVPAVERSHVEKTTAIGTVVALRSIAVRTELPGTVRETALVPGQVVDAGTVLVRLDVSVEQAELRA